MREKLPKLKKKQKVNKPKGIQYKFPKKITIGDIEYDITYDKENDDAEFSYPFKKKRGFIRFGTECIKTNPTRFINLLIHEFKEIIQVEQSTRYSRRDEHSANSFEFHYSHKEHTDLCARLAGLLTQFIK